MQRKTRVLKNNIIFGPVYSRRFGKSLGIDLSPSQKQCNFDCLYCELEAKKAQEKMIEIVPVKEVLEQLKQRLNDNINVLTITANGEPTLYPFLYPLMQNIKSFIPKNTKTLILSNGSKFGDKEVQKALLLFDIVKFSFDGGEQKIFSRIDRPHKSLSLDSIKQGILDFSKIYQGELVAEILFVKNINHSQEHLKTLIDFLSQVNPKRIDINTIDRPPAYKSNPLDLQELETIDLYFKKLLPHIKINTPSRNQHIQQIKIKNVDELYHLIKKRPLEVEETHKMLDQEALGMLKQLLKDKRIFIQTNNNLNFYTTKH